MTAMYTLCLGSVFWSLREVVIGLATVTGTGANGYFGMVS